MDLLTIDFETFFSRDYNLKRTSISNLEYIRDPRFEPYGASVKVWDGPSQWYGRDQLAKFIAYTDWANTAVISHNALFDHTILHEHYGAHPARHIDTLGLCRALLSHDLDFDLNTISPLLGGPKKLGGGDPLQKVKGRYYDAITPDEETELGHYAERDADMAWHVFQTLWPELPERERVFMDLIMRMSSQGLLHFDPAKAREARQEVVDDRTTKVQRAQYDETTLRSRDKFAQLLRDHGVEPPTKTNDKGKETWAMAKGDPAFVALRADPKVGHLVDARMAVTSNNALTRIDRLLNITSWAPYTLPVQLKYHGAHTGRLAGAGQINMQNLNARGVGAGLRKAIIAPPGYVVVVKDLKGIELRFNMWFSGQWDVLERIRQGGDPYIEQAAQQFGIAEASLADYEENKASKAKRNFGKVTELGCGYQMGKDKYRKFCGAGPMGQDPIYLTDYEAWSAIQTYRRTRPWVKHSWDWNQHVGLPAMLDKNAHTANGPIVFKHEAIELPGGMQLKYPNLEMTEDGFVWGMNDTVHRPYGGIIQENIVQACTGKIIKDDMVVTDDRLNGPWVANCLARGDDAPLHTHEVCGVVVHQVHDEIIALAPEHHAEAVADLMDEVMTITPDWAPNLPLETEGGYSYRYDK